MSAQQILKTTFIKSPQALAAKAIRIDLKRAFPGLKFRVTSESYSMGNAVRIYKPESISYDSVRAVVNKYQYGRFDGRTDSYEHNNKRTDLPQVMFVTIEKDY
jgi:hypothetical protein